jgi:uncharacterized protein (TIGR03032 family)
MRLPESRAFLNARVRAHARAAIVCDDGGTGTEQRVSMFAGQSETAQGADTAFEYIHSEGFAPLLAEAPIALLVSTYQAGKLMLIRPDGGRLSIQLCNYDRPMGVAIKDGRITVGTRRHVWHTHATPDLDGQPDSPQYCHNTGDVRSHEMAWVDDELWFVNTRYSCLCTLNPRNTAHDDSGDRFVPRWQPSFVTALTPEDRCHLNGLAVANGSVAYVTAHGRFDQAESWRAGKHHGGVVIDVPSGQILADGLCMPHSPRVYKDRLWLLNSGRGELVNIDRNSGRLTTIARLPGYTRGLAFHGQLAFIGLSRIRQTSTFGGVPIAEARDQRQCGIYIVDINSGAMLAHLMFQTGCEEIFDVQVLPD